MFKRFDKKRFFENLNVFVPLFTYGVFLATGWLTAAVSPAAPLPSLTAPFGVAAVLALTWVSCGLSPQHIRPERRRRYQLGHFILGGLNLALFCTTVLPFAIAQLPGLEAVGHLIWIGIPVISISLAGWPLGLLMVWTSRGRLDANHMNTASTSAPPRPDTPWRVGHVGRDCMYYEEEIDTRWERLEISGEMLMGDAHHVIYFDSAAAWEHYPAWARHRRDDIIARIKSKFRPPDYEYNDR